MASRTGTADLPLHGGKAPRWLFERMAHGGKDGTPFPVDPRAPLADG